MYLLKVDIGAVIDDHQHGAEGINRVRVDRACAALLEHEENSVNLLASDVQSGCSGAHHGRDLHARLPHSSDILSDGTVNALHDVVLLQLDVLCEDCLNLHDKKTNKSHASHLAL